MLQPESGNGNGGGTSSTFGALPFALPELKLGSMTKRTGKRKAVLAVEDDEDPREEAQVIVRLGRAREYGSRTGHGVIQREGAVRILDLGRYSAMFEKIFFEGRTGLSYTSAIMAQRGQERLCAQFVNRPCSPSFCHTGQYCCIFSSRIKVKVVFAPLNCGRLRTVFHVPVLLCVIGTTNNR